MYAAIRRYKVNPEVTPIGAINYHSGETVVLIRRLKRRREIASTAGSTAGEASDRKNLRGLKDNSNTHEDDEIEAVLRGAAGRLMLLYLPRPTTAPG